MFKYPFRSCSGVESGVDIETRDSVIVTSNPFSGHLPAATSAILNSAGKLVRYPGRNDRVMM